MQARIRIRSFFRLFFALGGMTMVLAGCPSGLDVEKLTFPCRVPEDCVEGYVCHPRDFVCVRKETFNACFVDGGPCD